MANESRIYAEAYEIKAELGGGFRGVAKDHTSGQIFKGEIRATFNEAKMDAHNKAIEFLAGRKYVSGSYRNRKNNWRMNYWIVVGTATVYEDFGGAFDGVRVSSDADGGL